jgi:hypothetical protein
LKDLCDLGSKNNTLTITARVIAIVMAATIPNVFFTKKTKLIRKVTLSNAIMMVIVKAYLAALSAVKVLSNKGVILLAVTSNRNDRKNKGCSCTKTILGDHKSRPKTKIRARSIPTEPAIVKQKFIILLPFSPALGRNLIIPKPNPKVENEAIKLAADIIADARPISVVRKKMAASAQNTNPETALIAVLPIRK